MVEFDIKINAEQRSAYIPKEIFAFLGTKVKAVPNRAAVVLFAEGLSLTDVLKSMEIIKGDIEHRIEMTQHPERGHICSECGHWAGHCRKGKLNRIAQTDACELFEYRDNGGEK